MYFIVLWSSIRFGHSSDHLQGDFHKNRNTVKIETCLNHATDLKKIYNSLHISAIYVVGYKSFRPDIQKPRKMENAVRDI